MMSLQGSIKSALAPAVHQFSGQQPVSNMGSPVPVLALLVLSCLAPAHQQSDEETVSLPLTPPIASAEVGEQNNATTVICCQGHLAVTDTEHHQRSGTMYHASEGTIVVHCPASNCTELFNLVQKGRICFSNCYWLVWPTEEVRKVYCTCNTQQQVM